jgi:hypothetical protein
MEVSYGDVSIPIPDKYIYTFDKKFIDLIYAAQRVKWCVNVSLWKACYCLPSPESDKAENYRAKLLEGFVVSLSQTERLMSQNLRLLQHFCNRGGWDVNEL